MEGSPSSSSKTKTPSTKKNKGKGGKKSSVVKVTSPPIIQPGTSHSSSGFESSGSERDVLEVQKDNQDYFELPPAKNPDVPPVPTKDLVYMTKEKLNPFRDLYEKQPQKIKNMMRLAFCKGKPVTNPPPLNLFINKVKQLQDKKRSKKQFQRRQFKEQFQISAKRTSKKPLEATVNLVDIFETDTQLIHVDYPGRVVHPDIAIETLGGIGQATKVFNNVNKKLQVRFRPEDLCCNSVRGEAVPSIGLLLRVRHRKPPPKQKQQSNDVNISSATETCTEKASLSQDTKEDTVIVNGVAMSKSRILFEDNQLMKKAAGDNERLINRYYNSEHSERSFLRIPKVYNPTVDQKVRIEALGITNRTYKFEGICDFQYLPINNTKMGTMSTRDTLFPIVGVPSENNDSLFVCDNLLSRQNRDSYVELLPPLMSRIDKPLDMVIENMMDSDNVKLSEGLKEKSGVISSGRARRNVYTIFYSFVGGKSKARNLIPVEPLKGAVDDVKKRPSYESSLEYVKKLFEEKPIWSKIALEYEAKPHSSVLCLKYILPCVAYFATNGPWRALWIRFGYDPRQHQSAFLFQTVDFRVPGIYKCYMDEPEKTDDTFYIFRPNLMPPRGQMFYQLCHLKCEEIDRLISIASEKASNNSLLYDNRYGWLKEGTFDYIRHVIVQYIECYLEELGKLPEHPVPKVFLPEGELEANGKLLPRPRRVKRLRKVRTYKPKQMPKVTQHNITKATKITARTKSGKKVRGKSNELGTQWAYQGILEDLSIKEISKYGSRQEEDKEILDDDSLISDEYTDDDSISDNSDDYDDSAEILPLPSNQ